MESPAPKVAKFSHKNEFPLEILLHIVAYLPLEQIPSLLTLSKGFNHLLSNSLDFWMEKYNIHFVKHKTFSNVNALNVEADLISVKPEIHLFNQVIHFSKYYDPRTMENVKTRVYSRISEGEWEAKKRRVFTMTKQKLAMKMQTVNKSLEMAQQFQSKKQEEEKIAVRPLFQSELEFMKHLLQTRLEMSQMLHENIMKKLSLKAIEEDKGKFMELQQAAEERYRQALAKEKIPEIVKLGEGLYQPTVCPVIQGYQIVGYCHFRDQHKDHANMFRGRLADYPDGSTPYFESLEKLFEALTEEQLREILKSNDKETDISLSKQQTVEILMQLIREIAKKELWKRIFELPTYTLFLDIEIDRVSAYHSGLFKTVFNKCSLDEVITKLSVSGLAEVSYTYILGFKKDLESLVLDQFLKKGVQTILLKISKELGQSIADTIECEHEEDHEAMIQKIIEDVFPPPNSNDGKRFKTFMRFYIAIGDQAMKKLLLANSRPVPEDAEKEQLLQEIQKLVIRRGCDTMLERVDAEMAKKLLEATGSQVPGDQEQLIQELKNSFQSRSITESLKMLPEELLHVLFTIFGHTAEGSKEELEYMLEDEMYVAGVVSTFEKLEHEELVRIAEGLGLGTDCSKDRLVRRIIREVTEIEESPYEPNAASDEEEYVDEQEESSDDDDDNEEEEENSEGKDDDEEEEMEDTPEERGPLRSYQEVHNDIPGILSQLPYKLPIPNSKSDMPWYLFEFLRQIQNLKINMVQNPMYELYYGTGFYEFTIESTVEIKYADYIRDTVLWSQEIQSQEEEFPELCKQVKSIFTGDISPHDYRWIEDPETYQRDLSHFFTNFPNLLHFRCIGQIMDKFPIINCEKLMSLSLIRTEGLKPRDIKNIIASNLPNLRHLELWFGEKIYFPEELLDAFGPLLQPASALQQVDTNTKILFPMLEYLGLRECKSIDELCEPLSNSEVVTRIRVLDLSLSALTAEGAQHLLKLADCPLLEILDIHGNKVTNEGLLDKLIAMPFLVDVS